MAQNEGRTLRRAPKLIKNSVQFVLLVAVATAAGLGVHQLKAFAVEAITRGDTAQQTQLPSSDSQNQATAEGSPQRVVVASTANKARVTPSVPSCIPGHYSLPTVINLSNLPGGVTTIEDSPQTYTIFGNTVEQQQRQLQQCAPVDEFAGAASYQVSWQYSYGVRGDGQCEIVSPKIGMHLNMVLPRWSASSDASDSVRKTWASFSSGLLTHERGHHAISRQYSKTMLARLQQVKAQDCATIRRSADASMNAVLAQLRAAQENYDANTNHGATQGAQL